MNTAVLTSVLNLQIKRLQRTKGPVPFKRTVCGGIALLPLVLHHVLQGSMPATYAQCTTSTGYHLLILSPS
jgi:hypothetical protein